MSLCIAWVRKIGNTEEVCVISDSCVTGGQRFMATPKLFPLKRGDCVIACAGNTQYSFPVVEHIVRAVDINQKLGDRASDLSDILHTILDISNSVLYEETEEQRVKGGPEFSMIVAGYSWKLHKPILKQIKYDKRLKKMVEHTQKTIKKTPFAIIGDHVMKVRKDIYNLLEQEGIKDYGTVDFQPLNILLKYIDDTAIREIGGYPQMVKVYPFLKTLPWGILCNKNGRRKIAYFGRLLLAYETFPYPIYDVDRMEVLYMKENSDLFNLHHEETKELTIFKEIDDNRDNNT